MSQRRLNKRSLILCEGTTEELYAKSLRSDLPRKLQRSIAVEIALADRQDPMSLVKQAIAKKKKAKKEKNQYDVIWLFFDHDNWPQLKQAFESIAQEGLEFAFTSLCIEHWFILHFEDCGRVFQKGIDAFDHLGKLWPGYHKTKMNHYALLKSKLAFAIERANQINTRQEDLNFFEKNPYCSIPQMIAYFNSLQP